MGFDTARVRRDFPILRRKVATEGGRERKLTYLDHGASTHAPQPVIDAVTGFLSNHYANVHRGNHTLSQEASAAFEDAAATLGRFIGADPATQPICLTGNTTQALDLAAHLMEDVRGATLVTQAEHHSNDLPHRLRGKVVRAPVDGQGTLLLDEVERLLGRHRVKLLAVTGASNVTGVMPPIHKLARLAHDAGARILVDAAQLYAHAPIDVKDAGHAEHLDFLAAAGHKAYAPLGSAFLAAPADLVDEAPPHVTGGGTVEWVTETGVKHKSGPERHHGGTPNIVGAVAFAASTSYLSKLGMDNVRDHELGIVRHGLRRFRELAEAGVHLLGPTDPSAAARKVGVFAFVPPGLQQGEASKALDRRWGIATRNGCFCAQPLLNQLLGLGVQPEWTKRPEADGAEIPGAVRASVGVYNTQADLDLLLDAVATLAAEAKAKGSPTLAPTNGAKAREGRVRRLFSVDSS
ncbi:MAG TPA: aminotransferase class V-fold PLP-dependent enzyme [Candidatus Thermoplasmatota archaeon]|nr:aminotransferase class V-fold PLP-dependent enzyme [Candidatus Thermoplasmatota archaeon]